MKTIRKAGALIFVEKKLLIVKPYTSNFFINPGGKYEGNETPRQCLERELQEELNIRLDAFEFFRTYEIPSAANTPVPLSLELYHVSMSGIPRPGAEIETLAWLGQDQFETKSYPLAPSFSHFIPDLIEHHFFY